MAETITNKGTYVAQPLTKAELEEVFKLRIYTEPNMAVTALNNLTDDQIGELEQLSIKKESLTLSTENFSDHFMLNREFHLKLYQPAGWNHLLRCIALWLDQILIFRSCLCRPDMYKDLFRFNEDHQKILKAPG